MCGQTRTHCFGVDEVILPCPQCDRDMAFDTELGKQTACPHCNTAHVLPTLPPNQYQHILLCYACLRAGWAFDHNTVVGIVA